MKTINQPSLCLIGLAQALGVAGYCGLIGLLFWQGQHWFGNTPNYWGPVLMLVLLSVSVLICGLITFTYPVILFWEQKQTKAALTVVAAQAGWLLLLALIFITIVFIKSNQPDNDSQPPVAVNEATYELPEVPTSPELP